MRIIAGELRGRRLAAPADKRTRPMLDRVREALFSILGQRVEGARVLDLFAGTGSLGIEALSRGAREARFLEQGRKSAGLLRKNLADLELVECGTVLERDALAAGSWGVGPWDVVFMDPPYPFMRDAARQKRVLACVARLVDEQLSASGVLVLHVPKRALTEDSFGGSGLLLSERVYGTTSLWFVARAGPVRSDEADAAGQGADAGEGALQAGPHEFEDSHESEEPEE